METSFYLNSVAVPVTRGYLSKNTPNHGLLQRRYFVLEPRGLLYYKTEADASPVASPLGSIDLKEVMPGGIEAFHIKKVFRGTANYLKIITPKRIWTLTADSLEELGKWHHVFYSCHLCKSEAIKTEDSHKEEGPKGEETEEETVEEEGLLHFKAHETKMSPLPPPKRASKPVFAPPENDNHRPSADTFDCNDSPLSNDTTEGYAGKGHKEERYGTMKGVKLLRVHISGGDYVSLTAQLDATIKYITGEAVKLIQKKNGHLLNDDEIDNYILRSRGSNVVILSDESKRLKDFGFEGRAIIDFDLVLSKDPPQPKRRASGIKVMKVNLIDGSGYLTLQIADKDNTPFTVEQILRAAASKLLTRDNMCSSKYNISDPANIDNLCLRIYDKFVFLSDHESPVIHYLDSSSDAIQELLLIPKSMIGSYQQWKFDNFYVDFADMHEQPKDEPFEPKKGLKYDNSTSLVPLGSNSRT